MRIRFTVFRVLVISFAGMSFGCSSSQPATFTPAFLDDAPANRQMTASEFPNSFVDHDGVAVDLTKYRGKPVVIVVVRGMPESPGGVFCPNCLAQASSLSANYEQFTSRGAELLLVYPGPRDRSVEFRQQVKALTTQSRAMPYPVCLDQDCSTCSQLGIRGDLAKPSTFILNAKGEVVYAYVGRNTSDRPSIQGTLTELDRLKK